MSCGEKRFCDIKSFVFLLSSGIIQDNYNCVIYSTIQGRARIGDMGTSHILALY